MQVPKYVKNSSQELDAYDIRNEKKTVESKFLQKEGFVGFLRQFPVEIKSVPNSQVWKLTLLVLITEF